jgi:hypothetical protein
MIQSVVDSLTYEVISGLATFIFANFPHVDCKLFVDNRKHKCEECGGEEAA